MARIIVADDEATHLEMVETMLQRAGHQVVAVANGQACLERLEAEGADLVVTDIFMPDADGFEFMVAALRRGIGVPVIGMTGGMRGEVGSFTNALQMLGASAVLVKPFSRDELLGAVNRSLKNTI